MKSEVSFILLIFITSLSVQCGSSFTESFKSTPKAIGSVNQLVVICDEDLWASPVGDTFRYRFESAYPLLPAPEPFFDVKYYAPEQLIAHPLRKELRTYIYLGDLSDSESLTSQEIIKDLGEDLPSRIKEKPDLSSITGRDKWAQGQLIVYLFGMGKERLIENINRGFYPISRRINDFDGSMINAYCYLSGESQQLKELMKKKFDVTMNVPGDFVKAMDDENTLWLRKDEGVMISNIIIRNIPYRNEKQLTKDGIKNMVNQIGRDVVTSETPGSFMTINDVDLPIFLYYITLDDAYTVEARGIWELTYDYMGGPFLAYAIKYPEKEEILLIHSFVYAPGKKKRDYIQRLEHIIGSLDFSQVVN